MNVTDFFERIDGDLNPDDCWAWTGGHHLANGESRGAFYADFMPGRKIVRMAHQVAYFLAYGPVPGGLEIDHLCVNGSCVNPRHMQAVTHAENMRRIRERATHCVNGHPWTEETTEWTNGRTNLTTGKTYRVRKCRLCRLGYYRDEHPVERGSGVNHWNSLKTHCPHGHEYSEANTYINRRGSRVCRTCRNLAVAAAKSKKDGSLMKAGESD